MDPLFQIIIHMEGGVIQSVTTSGAADIMVIDYDDDFIFEAGEEVQLTQVDQGEDHFDEAIVCMLPYEVDAPYCDGRIARFAQTQGAEC